MAILPHQNHSHDPQNVRKKNNKKQNKQKNKNNCCDIIKISIFWINELGICEYFAYFWSILDIF